MTPTTPTPLDVLIADRDAINATITSLRHRIANGSGRDAADYRPHLDAAVDRLVEVEGEIAAMEVGR